MSKRSSSSADKSRSRFLCLMVVIAENPNSHIQEVKTATEVAKLSQRWFSTSNQNASKFNSACFSFSILSLVIQSKLSMARFKFHKRLSNPGVLVYRWKIFTEIIQRSIHGNFGLIVLFLLATGGTPAWRSRNPFGWKTLRYAVTKTDAIQCHVIA